MRLEWILRCAQDDRDIQPSSRRLDRAVHPLQHTIMRRFHFILFFILTLCGCAGVQNPAPEKPDGTAAIETPAPSKTVIHDPAEAKQLLGKHLFTDSNLCCRYVSSHVYFGEAIVYEQDSLYRIHGGHEGYYRMRFHDPFRGGFLKIDGAITDINTNKFTFEGTIETAKLIKDNMHTCPRTGRFSFSREKHAAYWRLQTFLVPDACFREFSNEANYIDLFSQQEPE